MLDAARARHARAASAAPHPPTGPGPHCGDVVGRSARFGIGAAIGGAGRLPSVAVGEAWTAPVVCCEDALAVTIVVAHSDALTLRKVARRAAAAPSRRPGWRASLSRNLAGYINFQLRYALVASRALTMIGWALRGSPARRRDPNRRLGGAVAAQRAALDRSWIGLGPCTKRHRLDVILRHHGAILHAAAVVPRADIPHVPQ